MSSKAHITTIAGLTAPAPRTNRPAGEASTSAEKLACLCCAGRSTRHGCQPRLLQVTTVARKAHAMLPADYARLNSVFNVLAVGAEQPILA